MTKNLDIVTHVSKLQNLAHGLKSLGEGINDSMIISKILVTLPNKYQHFATAWVSTAGTEKTLENLVSRLMAEEIRNNSEKEKPVAFKTYEKRYNKKGYTSSENKPKVNVKDKQCYNCNKFGHIAANCMGKSSTNNPRCRLCKKNNHWKRTVTLEIRRIKINQMQLLSTQTTMKRK